MSHLRARGLEDAAPAIDLYSAPETEVHVGADKTAERLDDLLLRVRQSLDLSID